MREGIGTPGVPLLSTWGEVQSLKVTLKETKIRLTSELSLTVLDTRIN